MKDDSGDAIIVLPIAVLTLVAGAAALAGIALQPSDPVASTTPNVITLGQRCDPMPGPRPASAAQLPAWLASVRTCLASELAGIPGYEGTSVEGFSRDVLVVRWDGEAPVIVVKRVAVVAGDGNAAIVPTS